MTATIHHGDMLAILPTLPAASINSCVTDPPYGLAFMGRKWDAPDNVAFRADTWREVLRVLKPGAHLAAFGGTRMCHRMVCAIEDAGFEIRDTIAWIYGSGFPKSLNIGGGFGTALKPAHEPIVLARKPLIGTVAANVEAHGCGALNIDGCRVATGETIKATRNIALGSSGSGVFGAATAPGTYAQPAGGRWPANVAHDGSEEVLAGFPVTEAGGFPAVRGAGGIGNNGHRGQSDLVAFATDSGSAARFFYCAKASHKERADSKHPTVKPVALMRWLTRLVTPPGGVVLDCFAGSGATGEACVAEGFRAVLIEREAEFVADIKRRLARAGGQDGPLFGGPEMATGGGDGSTAASHGTDNRTNRAEVVMP